MAKDDREMLEWLCWRFAIQGERFYPPEETAEECMDIFEDMYEGEDLVYHTGVERGQHARAWTDAMVFFEDMKKERI